jgi:8-oxo-dGTP pyrophosphatase MutT (NUDIX family)
MVDGAARECLEETGYGFVSASAEPFYVGEGFVCWNPERGVYYHMIGAVFRGAVDDEPDPTRPPDPAEIRRVAWLDPADLTIQNTHPNFWTVLQRAGLIDHG